MRDKAALLDSLHEELGRWEAFLATVDAQTATAVPPGRDRSLKDDLAHLYAWQGITLARLEAAAAGGEPDFGAWPEGLSPNDEEDLEPVNAWIYARYRERPWAEVYAAWHGRYLAVLEAAAALPAEALFGQDRYPWLAGYALSDVLAGTWEHHQEHFEDLRPH